MRSQNIPRRKEWLQVSIVAALWLLGGCSSGGMAPPSDAAAASIEDKREMLQRFMQSAEGHKISSLAKAPYCKGIFEALRRGGPGLEILEPLGEGKSPDIITGRLAGFGCPANVADNESPASMHSLSGRTSPAPYMPEAFAIYHEADSAKAGTRYLVFGSELLGGGTHISMRVSYAKAVTTDDAPSCTSKQINWVLTTSKFIEPYDTFLVKYHGSFWPVVVEQIYQTPASRAAYVETTLRIIPQLPDTKAKDCTYQWN
jgi:hypothetical protein